ncbi:hypothetical protein MRX96_020012 [Rhipicephalus microplus]
MRDRSLAFIKHQERMATQLGTERGGLLRSTNHVRDRASKLSKPPFQIVKRSEEQVPGRRRAVFPPASYNLSSAVPVCVVQMATQDRAGPSAPRRSTTGEHRKGHVDLPQPLPFKTGLHVTVEPTAYCCRGQYSHLILTALATTAEPVEKHGVIPFILSRFRNKITREAASDEQLVALSPKALCRTTTAPGSSGSILACLLTTHLRGR